MRVLHIVESYYPSIGGMQEVVRQLSERLVKMSLDVTVFTSFHKQRVQEVMNGVRIHHFKIRGNDVHGIQGEECDEFRRRVLTGDWDIVVCFAAQHWATDLFISVINSVKAKKIFVPTGFSGLYLETYSDYFNKIKTQMLKFDKCVFLSENYRDINFYREIGGKDYVVIPNAADENEFVERPRDTLLPESIPPRFKMLHVGSFTGTKGQLKTILILFFMKTSNVEMFFVGNVYSKKDYILFRLLKFLFNVTQRKKKIHHLVLSREDTIRAYFECDAFLFPSLVECSPLVLFECCAAGLPFFSSDVGNASEIVKWTNGGVILPTRKDHKGFSHVNGVEAAKIIDKVLLDKKKMSHMARCGRESWIKKFTWAEISKAYLSLYKGLMRDL